MVVCIYSRCSDIYENFDQMAGNRIRWRNNLRSNCRPKEEKPKIKILSNVLLKKGDEPVTIKKHPANSITVNEKINTDQQSCNLANPLYEIEIARTPHHNKHKVKTLTPTFRNPNNYLEATHQVMKQISPISDENIISDYLPSNLHAPPASVTSLNVDTYLENKIIEKTIEEPKQNVKKTYKQSEECILTNNTNKINNSPFEINVIIETHNENSDDELDPALPCCGSSLQITEQTDSTLHLEECDAALLALEESDIAMLAMNQFDSSLATVENNSSLPDLGQSNTVLLAKEQTKSPLNIAIDSVIGEDENINNKYEINSNCIQSRPDTNSSKRIVRKSKRKLNFNKSYLDFADDDPDSILLNEAFPSESSSYEISEESACSGDEEENKKKKIKKNKKSSKKSTKVTKKEKETSGEIEQLQVLKRKSKTQINDENLKKRKKGESYVNKGGELVEGKRMQPNPCVGKNCPNKCENISEERRERLFKYFWDLGTHQRRKDWIAQCAIKKNIKRADLNASTNRSCAYEYYINEGEGRRRVCQKFLINTFNITQKFILYTVNSTVDGFAKEDMRGKVGHHNKTPDEVLADGKQFILSLPVLPSHYCRRDSEKLYLPEEFKNITNLYRIYQSHFEDSKRIMSFKVFSKWFKETFKIGFHVPKKDKCILCGSAKTFDVLNKTEMEKLMTHEKEKEESYKRFKLHQSLNARNKNVICASFDLQKVLNTPHGESMILYYSRKIACYNFTIYESGTQKGFCYVWTEVDARRGANEIATCLFNYIKNVDKRGDVNKIIFYCDSAYGQNKNKTILAMFRYALSHSKNLEVIQINYLIPGHTYMPVDSMHATIESSIRKTIVWVPSQWSTIIALARKNPEPYHVTSLNGSDFLGFDKVLEHTFKKHQKLQISKISIVTCKKSQINTMFIKKSMLPNAETTEVHVGDISGASLKTELYPCKISISTKKYTDLKKLVEKQAIPRQFADEYLKLKASAKTVDCLPDTDIEDDV